MHLHAHHEAVECGEQVIGRDKEVARMVQVLARKRKNNPILLGEPGVGKTAIAEGLARAIVSGEHAWLPRMTNVKGTLLVLLVLSFTGTSRSDWS